MHPKGITDLFRQKNTVPHSVAARRTLRFRLRILEWMRRLFRSSPHMRSDRQRSIRFADSVWIRMTSFAAETEWVSTTLKRELVSVLPRLSMTGRARRSQRLRLPILTGTIFLKEPTGSISPGSHPRSATMLQTSASRHVRQQRSTA